MRQSSGNICLININLKTGDSRVQRITQLQFVENKMKKKLCTQKTSDVVKNDQQLYEGRLTQLEMNVNWP